MKSIFLTVILILTSQIYGEFQFEEAVLTPDKLFFCQGLEKELLLSESKEKLQIKCNEDVHPKLNNTAHLEVTFFKNSQTKCDDEKRIEHLKPLFALIPVNVTFNDPQFCNEVFKKCSLYQSAIDSKFSCTCDDKKSPNSIIVSVVYSIADYYDPQDIALMYFSAELSLSILRTISPVRRWKEPLPRKVPLTDSEFCRLSNGLIHSNYKLLDGVNASCETSGNGKIKWKSVVPKQLTRLGDVISIQVFLRNVNPAAETPIIYEIPTNITCNFFEKKINDAGRAPEIFETKCENLDTSISLQMSFELDDSYFTRIGPYIQDGDFGLIMQMSTFAWNMDRDNKLYLYSGEMLRVRHNLLYFVIVD